MLQHLNNSSARLLTLQTTGEGSGNCWDTYYFDTLLLLLVSTTSNLQYLYWTVRLLWCNLTVAFFVTVFVIQPHTHLHQQIARLLPIVMWFIRWWVLLLCLYVLWESVVFPNSHQMQRQRSATYECRDILHTEVYGKRSERQGLVSLTGNIQGARTMVN